MSEDKGTVITLSRPKLQEVHFGIVGLTNLICCALPRKIKDEEAVVVRRRKPLKGNLPEKSDDAEPTGTPEQQFRKSLYPMCGTLPPGAIIAMPDGGGLWGFPSSAIQASCATFLQRFNPINPKYTKDTPPVFYGATFMVDEMIPIVGDGPHMRHDIVRNSRGKRLDTYRGEFKKGWTMLVKMEFDANIITLERLTNALDGAGRKVGIGAWRPECRGRFGRFEVDQESITLVKIGEKEEAAA
jgi:hypothetical protein